MALVGKLCSEQATDAFDKEAIKEIVEISGDERLLGEFNCGEISFHRHPEVQKTNNSRPHKIKNNLGSQEL